MSLSKRHQLVNDEQDLSTKHILVQQKDFSVVDEQKQSPRHLVDKQKNEEDKVERRTSISEKETGKGKVESNGKGKVEMANDVGKSREVEVENNIDVTRGACLKTSTSLIKVTGSRLCHAQHLKLLKHLEK